MGGTGPFLKHGQNVEVRTKLCTVQINKSTLKLSNEVREYFDPKRPRNGRFELNGLTLLRKL